MTTVPTMSDTTMVRTRSCMDVLGRSMPNALSRPCSPSAIPIPATMPRTEATNPVTVASDTTETMTCRRLAPMARRSASSFVRCATMMENVLKMMKAPTNSAMNANASSAVRKNPSPSCSALDCSSDTVALVTASTPFGRAAATRTRRAEGSTPSFATTSISSNTPALSRKSCAVGRSNSASVAPPRLSTEPNPVMPEIVKDRMPLGPEIEIVSPSVRWYFDAVPASTTTCSGPWGGAPCRSTSAPVVSVQFPPKVGAKAPIALFVAGSIICAVPVTSPDALATPLTASTSGSTEPAIGSRWSVAPP